LSIKALQTPAAGNTSGIHRAVVFHGRYRSLQLQASIARALVDTDDLDRIFPAPPDDAHKTVLTERNPA
jgi:hypothetical protein